MATKKFIIEVEEGLTRCSDCPLDRMNGDCHYLLEIMFNTTCQRINLATMKITEYNEGQALLYAVNKTAERTKREVINKAVAWLKSNSLEYEIWDGESRYDFLEMVKDFKQAMEE